MSNWPMLIFGVPGLSATNCDGDPRFDIRIQHADVDADVPGTLSERPSAWQSGDFAVAGGGIGSSGNVICSVPATGGTLYRDLTDNWLSRCQHLAGPPCAFAIFPVAYFYHCANRFRADYGSPYEGYSSADEDVTWYQSHRYLEIALEPADTPTATEFTVRLTYRTESVEDDHRTSSDRAVSCSLSGPQTVSYTVEWSDDRLWVDLWTRERPRLEHVTRVEIDFPPEAMQWTLGGMWLRRHSDHDPERSEVTPHGLLTFHEPRDRYAAGGLRAVVDGKCEQALRTSGNFNVYSGHEEIVEHINWVYGGQTGADLSGAWSLEGYLGLLGFCCEGFGAQLPADWDGLTEDADENVLTGGYSFDLCERQDCSIDGGTYPGRFGAYFWQQVQGILYKPHGLLVVQGGTHGMASARDRCSGRIYQREAGSGGEWGIWEEPCSDGHGYWYAGLDIVSRYDGTSPVYYEYRVNAPPEETLIARAYERQWEWAWLRIIGGGRPCGVYTDPDGVAWYVWIQSGTIRVAYMQAEYDTFRFVTDVDSSGEYDSVDIHGDGRMLYVGARNSSDEKMYSFHSLNMGDSWSGPHLVG